MEINLVYKLNCMRRCKIAPSFFLPDSITALGQIQRKCLKQPWRRENSLQSEPFYTCEPPNRQIFFFYKIDIETLTNQKLSSIMIRIPFFKSCYRVLLVKVLVFYTSTSVFTSLCPYICKRIYDPTLPLMLSSNYMSGSQPVSL